MAGFPITPAWDAESSAVEIDEGAAQTFSRGAAVVLAAGLVTECGADPALVYGFAGSAATKQPQSLKAVGAAAVQRDIVHKAWEGQKFWATPVVGQTFVAADINTNIGLTKDADGVWKVDRTKTAGTARCYIHYVDLDRNMVLVSVLAANRQVAP